MKARYTMTCSVVGMLCSASLADPMAGWYFDAPGLLAGNIMTGPGAVDIAMYIWYKPDPSYYAFADSKVVLSASDSHLEGFTSGYGNYHITKGAFTQQSAGSVLFQAFQPHFGPTLPPSTENPARAARIVWSTTDPTPRTVEITTSTLDFAMYISQSTLGTMNYPVSGIEEAKFVITITPAPSSALALLAGAGLVGVRRRR